MTRKQCLDILDLPAGASPDEIIKAYRHLAQVWHPDRFPNNPELQEKAHAKLAEINQAYSTLIEGRATPEPDESSPKNDRMDTGQSPQADSTALYRDAQVRYLGDDPRLKAPSQWGAFFGNSGVLSAVEVSSTGFALVTSNSEGPDEAMWYAASSLVAVRLAWNRWVCPGNNFKEWSYGLDELSPAVVRLHIRDPEGILKQLVVVNLKFRNDYFAQLFIKRLQFVAGLEEWTAPPPPKPELEEPSLVTTLAIVFGLVVAGAVIVISVLLSLVQVGSLPHTPSPSHSQSLPSNAQTKGSFTVWTEPKLNLDSSVVIQISLPLGMTEYPINDMDGSEIKDGGNYRKLGSFDKLLSRKAA